MWLANRKITVTCALIVLSIITTYIYLHLLPQSRYSDEKELQKSLNEVYLQLVTLRQLHSRLLARVKRSPRLNHLIDTEVERLGDYMGPTEEYENLRRRIYSNIKELWYYLHDQLGTANPKSLQPDKIKTILKEVADRKRSLLSDQEKLPTLDGYETWRRHEAASVGDLVQRRLHYLQHPRDCRAARKIVFDHLNQGFGWQFLRLVSCLIHAYASERTLIKTHRMKWVYNRKMGWNSTFLPLSKSCTSWYNDTLKLVSAYSDAKVTWFMTSAYWRSKKKVEIDYEPYYIPIELVHRITRFNGDPTSWWIGQMYKYLYKVQKVVQMKIERRIHRMGYKPPIVGVHVRRTDKIKEAKYHDIDEYMSHVEDYYAQLELTRAVDQRRVYLATDDATVLEEAIKKYPQYTFYGDYTSAQRANTSSRYCRSSLAGLLVDLHMLTLCDYVVLTFSSNFGRMIYALMQSNRVDASNSFASLDHFFYFSNANSDQHFRIAIMHHKGDLHDISFDGNIIQAIQKLTRLVACKRRVVLFMKEIPPQTSKLNFRVAVVSFYYCDWTIIGDIIDARTNFWNGTGNGTCIKSNATGFFPWYKTVEYLVSYPFPEYKQVPIYTHSTSSGTD